jgi:hypothetical protein
MKPNKNKTLKSAVRERQSLEKMARGACYATLSDSYVRYLELCAPPEVDLLSLSIQDCHFRGKKTETFEVLQIGDGTSYNHAYVRCSDGVEAWIQVHLLRVVSGDIRKVKKRGMIRMGKTSLMGGIAHGIKSGRAFRGRG